MHGTRGGGAFGFAYGPAVAAAYARRAGVVAVVGLAILAALAVAVLAFRALEAPTVPVEVEPVLVDEGSA